MGLVSSTITGCFGLPDGGRYPAFTSGTSSYRVHGQHATRNRPKPRQSKILFYEKGKPYYEFTNFSPHHVVHKGKRYPTSEHLFQAFKFIDVHPRIAEHIRTCSTKPMVAFDEAHKYQHLVRPDWSHVHIEKMEIALKLKFTQHPNLRKLLLSTRDAELVEDSPRDWFWGIGADGTGSNELGKALMRLRDELRHTGAGAAPPVTLPYTGSGLCEYCGAKPKYQTYKYCSQICADQAALMCNYCRKKRKARRYAYCSKTCANKARGK